mgnify:CR=1 FL=1
MNDFATFTNKMQEQHGDKWYKLNSTFARTMMDLRFGRISLEEAFARVAQAKPAASAKTSVSADIAIVQRYSGRRLNGQYRRNHESRYARAGLA